MITIKEGLSARCAVRVERVTGSGAIVVTTPQFRIVDSARALIAGFDWATAGWDADRSEIYQLFDSAQSGLTAAGTYYMQLRGTLNGVKDGKEITVKVEDWGP